jgi:protein TonB
MVFLELVSFRVLLFFFFSLYFFCSNQTLAQNNTLPVSETSQIAEDTTVFEKPDTAASFVGGENAWRQFLERKLNPELAVKNGAPVGTYTVYVRFIVEKDGTLSGIQPLTKHGYGMEEEMVRVIKMSPKWKPAVYNGVMVRAYRKQPIRFMSWRE